MTAIINGVDFEQVKNSAIEAATAIVTANRNELRDIISNISEGLKNDIEFIAAKKECGEFNETDARVFLEEQKLLARIRLRSMGIITLQSAESVWNAIAGVFSCAIQKALGWNIL